MATIRSTIDNFALDYISNVGLQQKNIFEFIILRTPSGFGAALAAIGGSVLDNLVVKFFLQTIDIPTPMTFIEERVNGNNYIKSLEYGADITITFIETEQGFVSRYLSEWEKNIMVPDPERSGEYIFKDNQEGAKRTGTLLLGKADRNLSLYPRITFYGLLFKSRGAITIGHTETGNLTYQASFIADELRYSLLI